MYFAEALTGKATTWPICLLRFIWAHLTYLAECSENEL